MLTSLVAIATVARRELASAFRSPIAYAVGAAFLAVQGFSFWAVVRVLSDPRQPAPLGAVLRTHFGGTFLYWSVLFMLVSVIGMRLIAEERRRGTWETLLTAPVSEGEIAIGKWLGALAYFALLWLPTMAFPALLYALAAPGAAPEPGPIGAAYVGVLITGAGFLAVATAVSAATSHAIVAAVGTFALLIGLLLAGQVAELAPAWAAAHPTASAALMAIDVRQHMDRFARGALDLEVLFFYAGLAATGLAVAALLCGRGRRRRHDWSARALGAALIATIAALANLLVAHHPVTWDLTAADINRLEPRTVGILRAIESPVEALVVHAGEPGFAPIYDEVDRLLLALSRQQPRLRIAHLDPALEPQRALALADEQGLAAEVLRGGGAVVFRAPGATDAAARTRVVELLDMAEFGRDALGAGTLARLHIEEAFATALLGIVDPAAPSLCQLTGHGEAEAPLLLEHLQRDGYRIRSVTDIPRGPAGDCRVLLVVAPSRTLAPTEALAVDAYLRRGGRLLVLLDPRPAQHGLELVLAEYGIQTPDALVVDISAGAQVPELELAWRTHAGYAEHPITAGFANRRVTVWPAPRAVLARPPAVALVTSGPAAWAEPEVDKLLGGVPPAAVGPATPATPAAAGDGMGPTSIAAAAAIDDSGARVVVIGCAGAMTAPVARAVGANLTLARSAVAWLSGRQLQVELVDKTPEQVRLAVTAAELQGVFIGAVFGGPLLWLALGALVWWRRRG